MKIMKADELHEKLCKKSVTLIDVRELWEYNMLHIKEAHHIPLGEFSIKKLPQSSLPIVIHCAAGIRSAKACQMLLDVNESLEVYNLEGGIKDWYNKGYPVIQSD